MATKTEKRRAERQKEEEKTAREKLEHLTQNEVYQLENYCIYQILYANDCACNQIKFLEPLLKTVQYKTKRATILYGALMKRVNAYWKFIGDEVPQDMLANVFSEMDEYNDADAEGFFNAVDAVLEQNGVEHHKWVSKVQTALVMCQFAVTVGMTLTERLRHYPSAHPFIIRRYLITDILRVMDELWKFVEFAAVMEKKEINLAEEPTVKAAFNRLKKAFFKPENYTTAMNNAMEQSAKEGVVAKQVNNI